MTRDELLTCYRPIRASIRRILSAAVPVCNQTDLTRAAKQLGLWAEGTIFLHWANVGCRSGSAFGAQTQE
jgi:hypothetical protein